MLKMGHGLYHESLEPMYKTILDNYHRAFEPARQSGSDEGE